MKKQIIAATLLCSFFALKSNAQVNTNQPTNNGATGENVFIDASTNFSDANAIGKGLLFPRTNLTTWTFKTNNLDGINFPTAFDGMIVYNTATGNTVSGQGVVTAVTPGFYFFSNPSGSTSITSGVWKPFSLTGTAPINVASGTISLNDGGVTTAKLADGSVTMAKINQSGATTGQVIKWNGSAWVPAADNDNTAAINSLASQMISDNNAQNSQINQIISVNDTQNNQIVTINSLNTTQNNQITQLQNSVNNPVVNTSVSGNSLTTSVNGGSSTVTLPVANGSETKVTAGTNVSVSGVGTTAAPYVISALGTVDATTTNKGIVQLAGDFSGTAVAPIIAPNAVTSAKILDATISAIDLATDAVTSTKILDGTITSVDVANSSITGIKLENNIALPGTASVILPSGTTAQRPGIATAGMSRYNTTDNIMEYFNGSSWVRPTAGSTYTGSTSTILNGSSFERAALTGDVLAPQNSNALTIANNAVTSTKIADGTITTADVANNAITGVKLENNIALPGTASMILPSGTTAQRPGIATAGMSRYNTTDNIMEYFNGSSWVRPTAGGTYTGSTSTILNGSSFERAALTGDVLAPQNSNALTIANNAVISSKIADGTITTVDVANNAITGIKLENNIALPGTASMILPSGTTAQRPGIATAGMSRYNTTDNIMEYFNGSTWVRPTTGATYTGSTSNILNGSSFERAALTGDVLAPQNSNALTISNNAVISSKIADGAITMAKINQAGADYGQVIKWNGGSWVAADDDNSALMIGDLSNQISQLSSSINNINDDLGTLNSSLANLYNDMVDNDDLINANILALQNSTSTLEYNIQNPTVTNTISGNSFTTTVNGTTSNSITLPSGPEGAVGPAGPTGPQGPAGSDATVTGAAPIAVASGVVSLNDSGVTAAKLADNAVTIPKLPAGATATTFLRGDGTWSNPAVKGLVNCEGSLTQTINDTNVTATSSIYVSYEDTTGDIIYTSIKNRVVGTGFTVQFGAIPSTSAKINYIIVQ